jgi:HAD superfamily hydrolase (TIGR01484 family)
MRYLALACDYDGTLASNGAVSPETLEALARLRSSGRKLILVTGRRLDDLLAIFAHSHLFDQIVAENGALLFRPESRVEKVLAEPPPEVFVQALKKSYVEPVVTGRVVVATWTPNETAVLRTIRELGLELQVIFNKGAVMVLPAGVNKASGLRSALQELGLSFHNVIGIGDAENDHAFLSFCECNVVVANALPSLKQNADWVTNGDHGSGVVELINQVLENDLRYLDERLGRHHLLLGKRKQRQEISLAPYGHNLLVAGKSGSGKSTFATSLLERLTEAEYQYCVIDPEGDYELFEGGFVLGTMQRAPSIDEVIQILEKPEANPVVNLVGLRLDERPSFFMALLPRIQELRARFGRPHWLIIDEAHHMLNREWKPGSVNLPRELNGNIFITVHPDELSPLVLSTIDTVIVVGREPAKILSVLGVRVGPESTLELASPESSDEVVYWSKQNPDSPLRMMPIPSRIERRRHRRKYAEGDLPPESSFYFRGPEGKLNLRANNLILFLHLADGVDDGTWIYHLKRGDYSRWFREVIKDPALAEETARIEASPVDAGRSRSLIRNVVEQHYTLPANSGQQR